MNIIYLYKRGNKRIFLYFILLLILPSIFFIPTLYAQKIAKFSYHEKLAINLFNNYKYASDNTGEYWQSPKQTLKLKQGDCEDFAILTNCLLTKKGYQSKMYVIKYIAGDSHAITVFKISETNYGVFSNQNIYYFKTCSFLGSVFEYIKYYSYAIMSKIYQFTPTAYGKPSWWTSYRSYLNNRVFTHEL